MLCSVASSSGRKLSLLERMDDDSVRWRTMARIQLGARARYVPIPIAVFQET
jgi:hypothetical protein